MKICLALSAFKAQPASSGPSPPRASRALQGLPVEARKLGDIRQELSQMTVNIDKFAQDAHGNDIAEQGFMNRADGANDIIEAVIELYDDDQDCLVIHFGGSIIGILIPGRAEHNGRYMHVSAIATHPGAQYCGSYLLEAAVNVSQARGLQGRLILDADSPAFGFYQQAGFECLSSDPTSESAFWTLEPATSPAWHMRNSLWRLTKYSGPGSWIPQGGSPARVACVSTL